MRMELGLSDGTALAPSEVDEALIEVLHAARKRRGVGTLDPAKQWNWTQTRHKIPRMVGAMIAAVRKGTLALGVEYRPQEILRGTGMESMHQGFSMLNVQFDLAIWRAPVKLIERPDPEGRLKSSRYELALR